MNDNLWSTGLGEASELPLLVLISVGGSDEELSSLAKSLWSQTEQTWLWLIVRPRIPAGMERDRRIRCLESVEEARPWLQDERCVAWICLDDPRVLDDHCALEKVRWCLRSYSKARFVAYSRDSRHGLRLQALRRRPRAGVYWSRGRGIPGPQALAQDQRGRAALFLLPWLEPGGADRCNLDIMRDLVDRGWRVCVVATLEARHAWQAFFRELTGDVLILPDFIRAETAVEFLLDCLASRRSDLLISSNCRLAYDALPLLREAYPQLPIVLLNHMEEAWAAGGYPGLAARSRNCVDRHWVVSDHLRDWLVARGVEAAKVHTLHWFADTSRWAPCLKSRRQFRERHGIPEHMPVIVFAGRLCQQKRPDILVRSLGALAEMGQEFMVLVAGDGELAPALRRKVQALGLQHRVHYLGWQDEDGLRLAFQAADLLFMPSEAEGIALVLYEAMACGLAVLASNVGGQAELVSDDCGYLVEPGKEDVYIEAIQRLLANPQELRRMGVQARMRVRRHFNAAGFSRHLGELLCELDFKPHQRVSTRQAHPVGGLIRLQWQWAVFRLLGSSGRQQLTSLPVIGRSLSLVLKAVLYAAVWGIGRYRLGKDSQ
ncbi:glycosyltransferase family 4 protein [Pseudomonas nitroreducens]|uniref:glycosyltransferase family 4 protein n=1 Tax=Pseudomonas nitroreducens TaxID=46680 RepID=UPI00265A79E1|nr:glycosyltransferase family 4 protein [Pseudomonas nitroreducens]MCP1647408.1 glycosyltransferase involved in cell wall biosynthesis [Pseudomonas nitroreducens]MCP1685984.1 glycosyltransferase involved in cell wall biosynthesis [Pseudomonas nitroreducens]